MKRCIGLAATMVVACGCSGGDNEIRERPGNTFVFEDRQSLQ